MRPSSCVIASFVALLLGAAALSAQPAPPSTPSLIGFFPTFPNALPSSQLPAVPMLGNGALGVMLDAHNDKHADAGPGRDHTFDVWLGSTSFWSCGTCTSISNGCCRVVSLGGLTVSLLPSFPAATPLSFSAEQRIGTAQLAGTFTTGAGGNASLVVFMHPVLRVVVANLTWAPAAGDPQELAVNVSVWAQPASSSGAHPAPASVGCTASTGPAPAPQPCAGSATSAASQLLTVSRLAATDASSPRPVRAAWAAGVDPASVAGPAVFAVTSDAPGGLFEAAVSLTAAGGGQPVSVVLAQVELVGGAGAPPPDPTTQAAALVAATLATAGGAAAGVSAAAAAFWAAFWAKSSVSMPGQPQAEAVWLGAQYALAATASIDPDVPPPGLYGVWATDDGCNWNGDYTLDYNAEATFFGAFSSNHAEQTQSYFQYLLDWQPFGRAMAQQQAAALGLHCDASALHYACHLAPWGFQSFDETFYMHWNGHYSALLFINAWEYTRDAAFAAALTYPYLAGHNGWWACALNKTRTGPGPGDYVYHDDAADAEHEGQVVRDPQIGLAFAARTIAAQIEMAAALGPSRAPPPAPVLLDIASHLAPFNTAPFNFTPPAPTGNVTYVIYNNSRFAGDSGFIPGDTLAACEAACAERGECALFTFCPSRDVPTCDVGPSCWQYTADKASSLHAGPGFTAGRKNATLPPPTPLTVWSAYAGAGVGQSDSFATYPLWPSEAAAGAAPPGSPQQAVAQASARAYVDWHGGRTVDVFSVAALAGAGSVFPAAAGGSVLKEGPAAPPVAFAPAELLAGLQVQAAALLGGNLLLRAPGGGVENAGVSRALNEMLLTRMAVSAAGGPALVLFPFWPADEPVAFAGLLAKGGFAVSAAYDNATRAVASPVSITAAYVLDGAPTSACRLADPWGVGAGGGVTVTCGGAAVPLAWAGAAPAVMLFDAPAGVACEVALPAF